MKIADLQILIKIAEHQSITAAANQLDISTSAASIALKRIEQSLGTQLFVRTTRQLRLSAEGERYLPICQQAVGLLQQGQIAINDEPQNINGEVRMSMSSEMGRNLMRNLLNKIMEQHPDLSLRLHISDNQVDFYRDGVDVALRAVIPGNIKDANIYGFKICNIPHFLCASPDYLTKHGTPSTPNELIKHNALLYKLYKVTHDNWLIYKDSQAFKIKMSSNRAANDGDLVRRWCIDGVGVAKKSAIDIAEALLNGQLTRVMTDYHFPTTELWLVLPSKQMITPAVRLVRDQLKQKVSELRSQLINANQLSEEEWPLSSSPNQPI